MILDFGVADDAFLIDDEGGGLGDPAHDQVRFGEELLVSATVGLGEGVDIQLVDDINHNTREMLLRQIILHRGGKQIVRVTVNGFEGSHSHGRSVVAQEPLL